MFLQQDHHACLVGQGNPPNDQAVQQRGHAELEKKQLSLMLLPMSLVKHTGH